MIDFDKNIADQLDGCTQEQIFETGRILFMREDFSFRPLIEDLVAKQRYDALITLIGASPINKEDYKNDCLTFKSGMKISERYFDVFIKIAESEGVAFSTLLPVLLYCLWAPPTAVARQWKNPAYMYFLNLAYSDYDRAYEYLRFDKSGCGFEILTEADKTRTVKKLLDEILYGSGDRRALRKYFFKYKPDIYYPLSEAYKKGGARVRQAAVRLAGLYRNDPRFSALCEEIASHEKSSAVLKALPSSASAKSTKQSKGLNKRSPQELFASFMKEGKEFDEKEFGQVVLKDKQNLQVASTLFFTVSEGRKTLEIVVVDEGRLNNLDNQPYQMPDRATIRVSHPTDFQGKYSFIPKLNIEQSIPQIKKKFYIAEGEEKNYNFSSHISGTIIDSGSFEANLKSAAMRPLSKNADGVSFAAGKFYGDVLAVLFYSPTELKEKGKTVTAKEIKFFDANKVIKFGGQYFTEGVDPLSISLVEERVFSEFITTVYEVLQRV